MAYTAYIDEAYYTDTYHGVEIDSTDFARIALRASDEIDKLTLGRIRRAGIDSFAAATQDAIKLATCAMAEALAQIDAATDGTGIISTSEKVGSFSYSMEASSVAALKAAAITSASSYLLSTGLLYAGM